jgi:hypothetical protein
MLTLVALQARYATGIREYIKGIVNQVEARAASEVLDLNTYMNYRIGSSAVRTFHAIAEFACGIDLPNYVLGAIAVQSAQKAVTEVTML